MTRRPTGEGHGVVVGPGEGETITQREHRDLAILAERDDITITRMRYGPGERGPICTSIASTQTPSMWSGAS